MVVGGKPISPTKMMQKVNREYKWTSPRLFCLGASQNSKSVRLGSIRRQGGGGVRCLTLGIAILVFHCLMIVRIDAKAWGVGGQTLASD